MKSNVLKKQVTLWAMLITLVSGGVAVAAGNGVDFSKSPEVSGTAEGQVSMPKEQNRIALDYVNQPPMIPHSVEGYQVTAKVNTCLKCHGVQSYRTTGAPRISPTHFVDSAGNVSSTVAPRRYFCQSCHVPQADAPPIIGNMFEPAPGYGQ
ncbi:nitrate reductase cytochrome c-type subunit [Budvicia diplopodorum]|uniref:nitrate reductase cytochrome c-type subunit n=1 Tax=Budvicia diplopodorum TaxID=1119056 RepID=UPI00135BEFE3|nr:nitrate reductase cytochrome c-type subunit [Budvicia diplopodorum]